MRERENKKREGYKYNENNNNKVFVCFKYSPECKFSRHLTNLLHILDKTDALKILFSLRMVRKNVYHHHHLSLPQIY